MTIAKSLILLFALGCFAQTIEFDPYLRLKLQQNGSVRADQTAKLLLLHRDSSVSVAHGSNQLEKILADSTVLAIYSPKPLYPTLDSALNQTHCESVHSGSGLQTSYKGKGVLIGFIDGGYDYTHPSFRKPDGSLRILKVWDQIDSTGTKPSKYNYGSELTSEGEIFAKQHDVRNSSHGTIVTSMAAGSVINGLPYYGIAPEADLIFVATNYESDGLIHAVEYLLSEAETQKRPIVINMSLASSNGPHDGTSLEDRFMEQNSHRGILVTAASNSGHVDQHIQFDLTNGDTLKTFAVIPDRDGVVDFWGQPSQSFSVSLAVTNHSGDILVKLPPVFTSTQEFDTIVGVGADSIRIQAAGLAISPQNGKSTITIILTSASGNPPSKLDISIAVSGTSGTIHGWNGMYRGFSDRGKSGYMKGNKAMTIGDGPGTSKGTITVGGWTSRTETRTEMDSLITIFGDAKVGEISFFSSRGPTADNREKPEITAPGNDIVGAFSSFEKDVDPRRIIKTYNFEQRNYPFINAGGTSLAAPIIAGTIALMLEAVPNLTKEDILTIFKITARNDQNTIEKYRWGYGKVDIAAAMSYVENNFLAISSKQILPLGITLQRSGTKIQFLSANGKHLYGTVSIFSTSGKKLSEVKIYETNNTIDLAGIGTGIYLYSFKNGKDRVNGKLFIPAYR